MFLKQPSNSKAYKCYDQNLELQQMLAYQSKNDINETQLRERRLSGDSQNQLQTSNIKLKESSIHEQYNFLKISGEQYIFQSNSTHSISSSNLRKVNFDFQEHNNPSVVNEYSLEKLQKLVQIKNQQIKMMASQIMSKEKQISDLKERNLQLSEQLKRTKSALDQNWQKQPSLLQSKNQSQWVSFNQNSRVNSPKQKLIVGRNKIIFNKVRPVYKPNSNACLDEQQKARMRKEYEKIISNKDKMIDQLQQKIEDITIKIQDNKYLKKKIEQLQQQLKDKGQKINKAESMKQGDLLKINQLSTQDEERQRQCLYKSNNQFQLQKQLALKQKKIIQLSQQIEIKNSTINYTQNQMMKIEIERINAQIEKQFFKQKIHKYQIEYNHSNRQQIKKTLRNQNITENAHSNNCLRSSKLTPQMLSPKQTVDFMIKMIKKAIKSENMRALLQKSPCFLQSINELLQILL